MNFIRKGIYKPSSGEATILGYNIKTQMNKIRASIGFCPQTSILYDDLTVYEHLRLIATVYRFFKSNYQDFSIIRSCPDTI